MKHYTIRIPWPYDAAEEEARQLLAAGAGLIESHAVLDALLEQMPDGVGAEFIQKTAPCKIRTLRAAEVRDLRFRMGYGFWYMPGGGASDGD